MIKNAFENTYLRRVGIGLKGFGGGDFLVVGGACGRIGTGGFSVFILADGGQYQGLHLQVQQQIGLASDPCSKRIIKPIRRENTNK